MRARSKVWSCHNKCGNGLSRRGWRRGHSLRLRSNQALEAIAAALEANRESILAANAEDLSAAKQTGLPLPLLKRLDLHSKFSDVVEMVDSVAAQPDPLGQTLRATELQANLHLFRDPVDQDSR